MKRGYHIRITVHRKVEISQSHPHTVIDTFVPETLFQRLPSHPPKSTLRKNAVFNAARKDYRYGPIRLDWTEFEHMSSTGLSSGKEKDRIGGPLTAKFVPKTKSGSTNLPEGVVHLYRDCEQPRNGETRASGGPSESGSTPDDGTALGVLSVPSWMTPSDFLAFVAPAAEGMAHLRLIRDSMPNRSIAVIKFRRPEEATEFAEVYSGKSFNSMDPETCHVVHILSVEIETEDAVQNLLGRLGSPQSSTYELPTCPVCLERMDAAVTGLITVPCSHTFHCMCLSKWGDSRCPVCRYSQTLLSSHPTTSSSRSRPIPFADASSPSMSTCADCPSTTNLWICLICGNIGCGRYGRAHAHAHYQNTTHLYALELETQRVWDYAGDGYVHRLIQNKADGKLVELPSAASSMGVNARDDGALGPTRADTLNAEKIEAIGIEYSYLLTSQLDSQREFYEEQTTQLKSQVEELRGLMEKLSRDIEKERAEARQREQERRREEDEKLDAIHREKTKAEKKVQKITELARKFEKELKEEKAVSDGLLRNLEKMKETVECSEKQKEEYDAKISELQEELRDVMFALEARSKIEQGEGIEAEAAGGSIELPPALAKTKKKGKKG
ncbi:hypothetical protein EDC04DRAFT_2940482 [Pisolithus marmoratus]|nr:hypothetical protein EDC04DRAFT_2940482 [Pisolithus marmoratus]